jgi:16S rRNA (guanine527-N7)-methyltransferase
VTAGLLDVLEEARGWGFLGPGAVEAHVVHAQGYAAAIGGRPPGRAADLGTGGGGPGLVLAVAWPASRWAFVESQARRAAFLEEAVERLDLAPRVEVVHRRAEDVGRDPVFRGRHDLVVARSFAPPAVTAECAAPLLRAPGGLLVVSEPPEGPATRWPPAGIAELGLGPPQLRGVEHRFVVLEAIHRCPERYPRRVGVPAKRPLFGFT